MRTIKHKFYENSLPTWECKTLILGTFNPEIGSDADYYYGRIRPTGGWSNRFWPSVNSYLEVNCPEIPLAEKGDLISIDTQQTNGTCIAKFIHYGKKVGKTYPDYYSLTAKIDRTLLETTTKRNVRSLYVTDDSFCASNA